MTIERDLDRRLASFFEQAAVQVPPSDLLAQSLARVDATRQRSAWRISEASRRPAIRLGGAFLPAWAALVLIALLAVAVVIVGSQLVRNQQTVISPRESSAIETNRIETPIPTPVDTRPPGVPPQSAMFAKTSVVVPFRDDVAWVATDDRLYRTEDTGLTWRAVQPTGWTQSAFGWAFVDADTAYLPLGDGRSVAASHDGGASWSTATLDASGAVAPVISSTDAMTAYVTFVDPALFNAPEGTGLIVFSTTDGGMSWQGPFRGTQPHLDDSLNKLYAAKGPFLVNSAGKAPGKPFENSFYMSGDGGLTWMSYRFPISSISPKGAMKDVGAIFVEPDGRLLVQFNAYKSAGPGGYPSAVYESTDDPAAWRLVYTGAVNVQFLSATTWMMPSGAPTEVRSTADAGQTWESITPAMSLYWAAVPSFGSTHTGWTTIDCRWVEGTGCRNTGERVILYVSTDGGLNWTEVGK